MSALIRPGRALITSTRVAEEDRLLDVVGDEQHGLALALPDAEQHFLHQRAGLVVERAERLVEQQDRRIVGERARDRGALLHAAGELLGIVMRERRQARRARASRRRSRPRSAAGTPFSRSPNATLSRDGEPGKQRVGLEHHAAIGAGPVTGRPSSRIAPGGRRVEPGDQAQQGRLAAAGRPEDGDEVVVADVDRVGSSARVGCPPRTRAERRARRSR